MLGVDVLNRLRTSYHRLENVVKSHPAKYECKGYLDHQVVGQDEKDFVENTRAKFAAVAVAEPSEHATSNNA